VQLAEVFISIRTMYNEYDMIDVIRRHLVTSAVICGFNYSALYKNGEERYGHVSIIESACGDNIVYLLDPGPQGYGRKCVKADQLFCTIKRVGDGLWCISPKKDGLK